MACASRATACPSASTRWSADPGGTSVKADCPRGGGLVLRAAITIIRSDMPHSTVSIKIDRDRGVVVYTGAAEIGQGSDTMTAQVAAEVLGCSLSRVKVIARSEERR